MIFNILNNSDLDIKIKIFLVVALPLVVVFSLSIHEFFHALTSYALGDPTAKIMRRMTLNPLKHLDPIGAACMLLFGFGWARPVPVDPRFYRNPKSGMALCGLAGPAVNAVIGISSTVVYFFMLWLAIKEPAVLNAFPFIDLLPPWLYVAFAQIFYIAGYYNILLAVFNLLPIPPLDGSRLLFSVLPDKQYFAVMKYERIIMFVMLALLWIGVFDIVFDTVPLFLMEAIEGAVNYTLDHLLKIIK